VFTPGSHGSTFGGNPLAAAVGLVALRVLEDENLVERCRALGKHMMARLRALDLPAIKAVRGAGLLAGIEIDPAYANARTVCERLVEAGVLSKETHETVIRLAPPLVISKEDLDWAIDRIAEVIGALTPQEHYPQEHGRVARPQAA
jgi:ornithine--oxo-acid transaminase